jgi:hypothetical protein
LENAATGMQLKSLEKWQGHAVVMLLRVCLSEAWLNKTTTKHGFRATPRASLKSTG